MASNYNEEDEEGQEIIPDNSAYNQLWQEALDVDEEVQRILQEHALPINDDELEHAEEALEEEEGEMKWVIFFSFKTLMRVSFVHPRNGIFVFCVTSQSSVLFHR